MVTPGTQCVMMLWQTKRRDPARGSLQGREGVANSLSRLAQLRALSFREYSDTGQGRDQGDGRYNLPISFIVGANYLHTLPFYLCALIMK